jgi:VCBS repeat-containing protein
MRKVRGLAVIAFLLASNIVAVDQAKAALYDFSSHTFTACGATGQSGPAQSSCISSYSGASWASNATYFSVTGGIQSWKVPGTGTYTIDLYGAKGGSTTLPTTYTGGQGARVQATVTLTEGHLLKILVGQIGGSFGYTAGGGGGTFLYNQTTSTAIAVAGGGGGAGNSGGNGYAASLNSSGTLGYSGYAAGTGGNGSASSGNSGWGMSGAGINGNGNGGGGGSSWQVGANALSFINGGTGAGQSGTDVNASCTGAWGGFGGGGGGACNGGGGGGGYSGGGSGGGGGGSYVTGSSTSIAALTGSEFARVVITASTPIVSDAVAPTITGPGSATGSTSSISIVESSTAVTTFAANETVTWSKSGTDGSFFSIGSSTGALTITARDFETKADANGDNVYVVVITATDGAANATSQTLSVTITNLNEAPVISTNSSAATYAITQAENLSTVATFAGSDVDTPTTLTFSVSGTDAADFQIGSASGVLSFAQNPDFELPLDSDANNIYVVAVVLSDGALSDTQTVTITITNVNENLIAQLPTLSTNPAKGAAVTISMTIDAPAKVMFFVNGKRISTCKARVTSGSYPNNVATCEWKPSVNGKAVITASVAPTTGNFSAVTSPPLTVFVQRRSGLR